MIVIRNAGLELQPVAMNKAGLGSGVWAVSARTKEDGRARHQLWQWTLQNISSTDGLSAFAYMHAACTFAIFFCSSRMHVFMHIVLK
jgi:hypothetical protein